MSLNKMPKATTLPVRRPRPAVSPVPTPDAVYALWKALVDKITTAILLACQDHRKPVKKLFRLQGVAEDAIGRSFAPSRRHAIDKTIKAHIQELIRAGALTKAGGRYVVPRTEMPGEEVPESPVITKAGAPPANPFESTGGSTTSAPGRVIE